MATNAASSTRTSAGCAAAVVGAFVAVFALLALALPLAFIGHGVYEAVAQDRDLRAARPVEATIVSSRVSKGRARPVIEFRYEVDGRTYVSDRSMLYAARGRPDGMTVKQFVAAHPPGTTVRAYYVPGEPWRGFLIKKYDEAPYIAIYLGLAPLALFFSVGLGYAFYPASAAAVATATPLEPGWAALSLRRPLRARVVVNLVQAAVYLSVWAWAAWHYFARYSGPHGVIGHVATWGLALPGVWYVVSAVRAHVTRRAVADPHVAVWQEGLHVGGEVRVRVEQDLLGAAAALERVRVGLVCEKTSGIGRSRETSVHWQTWTTPPVPAGVGPTGQRRRRIAFEQSLPLPADQPATQWQGDDRFAWKLVIKTALANSPDYREEFDLQVGPAEQSGAGHT